MKQFHLSKRQVIEAFYYKPPKLTGSEPVHNMFDTKRGGMLKETNINL